MSMPRRKTSSLRNSLWSCSSTGVRFIGEKPMAGCPAWGRESGVRRGLGQAAGTQGTGWCQHSLLGCSGCPWRRGRSQASAAASYKARCGVSVARGQLGPQKISQKGPQATRDTQSSPLHGKWGTARCWRSKGGSLPTLPQHPSPGDQRMSPGCPLSLSRGTTHMSLQTPLKAFHHGSDSSVEVMCWSMHF